MGRVCLAACLVVAAFAACGGEDPGGAAPGGSSSGDDGGSPGSSGSSGGSSGSSSEGGSDATADATVEAGAEAGIDAADATPAPCTRAAEAKTAPASLYDALKSDLAGLAAGAKSARVDTFLADVAAQGGTPLEDPKTGRTIFLARGTGPYSIVGTFGTTALAALPDTDLWTLDTTAFTTSTTYKLHVTDDMQDPLARNVVWDGVVRDSTTAFNLGQFDAVARPALLPMTQGRLTVHGTLHATQLNNDHRIFVYVPPKYDDGTCAKLPTITFQDGNETLTQGGYAGIADTVYTTDPTLSAVLVFAQLPDGADFNERTNEYVSTKTSQYVDFLTSDLWPAISGAYRVCSKAAARGISGVSYGGVLATTAAFDKPTTWGWVGAQSASYWWNNKAPVTRVSATDPKIDVRFYIDSSDQASDNYYDVENMKNALIAKAYVYNRVTVPVVDAKPHDFKYFKLRVPQMLTDFRSGVSACD